MLNEKITELRSQIEANKKAIAEQTAEAIEKANADAIEEAINLKADIDTRTKELADMEEKLAAMQSVAELESTQAETKAKKDDEEEKPESDSDKADEEAPKEVADEATDKSESEEDEDEKQEEKRQLNLNEKEDTTMTKEIITVNAQENNEELRSFEAYVRTKGQERAFKTIDGGAIIPTDISYNPKDEVATELDLRKFVNVVPVKAASGKQPILKATAAKMNTVAELAANPELANPEFTEITYDVETYRGYIPMSEEAIQDSAVDLVALIGKHVKRIVRNTSNDEIAKVLKTFTPVAAANLDDVKKVLNVDLLPAYKAHFVVSQSFFNAVDTMKDQMGHYILTPDIAKGSGYLLFGRPVTVIEDTVLGEAGDKVAFVGDLEAAVMYANRAEADVKWVDNNIYGQLLAASARFDVVKADEKAGFLVTLA